MATAISKFIQSCIHTWLSTTGKEVDFDRFPFLQGPIAETKEIGESFYRTVAESEGLLVKEHSNGGLVDDFRGTIDPCHPFFDRLVPEIAEFYEQTSRFSLEVWTKWIPPVSWGAKLLIRLVSVEMKQLNMPLDSLETSHGMSSAVINLLDQEGRLRYTCWLRKSNKSDRVVYAGFYSSFQMPGMPNKYVRVIFPLPRGNVTVVLKVELQEDGSVRLISSGRRFGDTGYYRLHRNRRGVVKGRRIPIKEVIHVFKDKAGILRTDHAFCWGKIAFLKLHYKINEKPL